MESAYTIVLPAGTNLYRGVNSQNNSNGTWFAYDIQDASAYGKQINVYKLNKDIKLINLISNIFQIEYIDKLNLYFTGQNFDGYDIRKIYALVPIGLPDSYATEYILKQYNLTIQHPTLSPEQELYSKCISSRFSDFEIDKFFSDIVRQIYSDKFGGFTLPLKSYNKLINGTYCREIHIFDTSCIDFVEEIQVNYRVSGGAEMISMARQKQSRGEITFQQPKIRYTDPIDLSKLTIHTPPDTPIAIPRYDPVIAKKNREILDKAFQEFKTKLAETKSISNTNRATRKQKKNSR